MGNDHHAGRASACQFFKMDADDDSLEDDLAASEAAQRREQLDVRAISQSPPLVAKCVGIHTAQDVDSEMSTTDVSGDTTYFEESDSDDRSATLSADDEAAAVDAVINILEAAESIDQVEDLIDNFLGESGDLSADAACRIDVALGERTNDVFFAKLQQSIAADAFPHSMAEALRGHMATGVAMAWVPGGHGDWG